MPLLPLYIAFLCLGLYSSENHAEEKQTLPDWDVETLSGAWHGQRAALYRQGIDIGLTHKSDGLADVSGGVKRGTAWLGHTEARINMDLEKILGWSGTNAFVLYQSDLGSKFNSYYVGAVVGVDNVEVAHNTGLFFDAWIQRKWLSDHLSLLAGLYHIDSEFNVINASSLFLQPAYGMSNEIALTGTNGPPIFPLGALAIRFKAYSPGMDFYIQAAITDGVPGDPGNPKGTQITLAKGDGTFSIAEIGYTPQTPDSNEAEFFNKTAIGFWCYSSKFEGIGTDNSRHHSRGAYFLKEKTLYRESAHPSQGLAGFVRFGVASDQANPLDWSGSMGLRYRGLVSRRDNDIAGIAATINHASSAYQKSDQLQSAETDIEITYSAQVKPWLSIQPTVQKIIHPGLMPQVSNAWIVGTRVQIEL